MKRLHYRADVREATVLARGLDGSPGLVPITEATVSDYHGAPMHVVGFEDDGRTVLFDLGVAVPEPAAADGAR